VAGALGEVEAAVDAVLIGPLSSLADDEVIGETRRLFVVMQRLSSRFAALVGEAEARQIPRAAGAATPTAWLADSLAMGGSEAHRWVKLAGLLRETPAVDSALAAGQVTVEQARVIAQTVHDLPAGVGDASRQHAVQVLTNLAAQERLRPEVLARHRETILEMVAPEVAEERLRRELERAERGAYDRRHFTMSRTGEGEYRLRGVFDAEMAAIVTAALDPLCKPGKLSGTATADTASADRGSGNGSAGGSAEANAFTEANGAISAETNGAMSAEALGAGSAHGTAVAGAAADPGQAAGGVDGRSAGARRADALIEICRRVLDGGELPDNGGEKPHLVMTMSWEQLRDQVGAGLLDTGDLLTPATVRRLACDAFLIPAVLGGDGQVLDVGRARRLIDGPLRRALVLRDRGCAWPGCDRPPRWCHGHHVVPWQDGGPTSLANSVMLCGFHHREIHKGYWQVRIAADGHPEFTPPAYIDVQRRPVRNAIHRRC
jgi:Domain of unknown function (DUF222)/HNH endonuclease